MLTYSGIHVTREFGAPSIRDMAVQSMRICRFAGAYRTHFWPVGMHTLLVADLVPRELEHHALLHDCATEVSMSDIPRPMKTEEQKSLENVLLCRTYESLGLKLPSYGERDIIHRFDLIACNAEAVHGCGPRGYEDTQTDFVLDLTAEKRIKDYLADYQVSMVLDPDGLWPIELERRMRRSFRAAQKDIVYHGNDN